jgi:hypothetical protein
MTCSTPIARILELEQELELTRERCAREVAELRDENDVYRQRILHLEYVLRERTCAGV